MLCQRRLSVVRSTSGLAARLKDFERVMDISSPLGAGSSIEGFITLKGDGSVVRPSSLVGSCILYGNPLLAGSAAMVTVLESKRAVRLISSKIAGQDFTNH